jgi:hypothetical protein
MKIQFGFLVFLMLGLTALKAQSPGHVSANISFWVEAGKGANNVNLTNTAATNGQTIDGWRDQSGNSRDATQATAALKPVFKNAAATNINSNPVVNFVAANSNSMGMAANGCLPIGNTKYSVYAVLLAGTSGTGSPGKFLSSGNCTGTQDEYLSFDVRPTNTIDNSWNQDDLISGNGAFTANIPFLASFFYNTAAGGTRYNFVNAVAQGTLAGNSRANANVSNGLGCQFSCPNEFFDGNIAEIITYSAVYQNGTASRNEIESYLGIKYGLTLGNNGSTTVSYVNTSNTVIWASNTGFHNDIAGIGRENTNEGLIQLKSESVNTSTMPFLLVDSTNITTDATYAIMGSNAGSITAPTTPNAIHGLGVGSALITDLMARHFRLQTSSQPASGSLTVEFDMSNVPGVANVNGLTATPGSSGNYYPDLRLLLAASNTFCTGIASEKVYSYSSVNVASNKIRFQIPYTDISANVAFLAIGSVNAFTAPLPVHFEELSATCNLGVAQLHWITGSETNNSYFVIERATESGTYVQVGTVPGAGTSSNAISYTWYDENPLPGTSYYRIRQFDYDGNFSYSPVTVLSGCALFTVNLFPNPFSDHTQLHLDSPDAANLNIAITDVLGRQVLTPAANQQIGKGVSNVDIDLSSFPSGFYFMRVVVDTKVYIYKLEKR